MGPFPATLKAEEEEEPFRFSNHDARSVKLHSKAQVSSKRTGGQTRPTTSFYVACESKSGVSRDPCYNRYHNIK